MILRSIKPISATKQLTPLDTDHVSLHPYQSFRLAINRPKCIYTMHPNAVYNLINHHSITHTHSTNPGTRITLWLYASSHSFTKPTNNTTGSRLILLVYILPLNQRQDANLFDFLNSTRCCWVCCSCSRPCFQHGQWSRSEDRFWTSPTIRLSSHGRLEGAYGESILRIIQGFTKI
jgi:hypothetical protein